MALLQWNCSVILSPFLFQYPCVMGWLTTLAVAIFPSWLRNNSHISLNASGHGIIPEREGKADPTACYSHAGPYPLYKMATKHGGVWAEQIQALPSTAVPSGAAPVPLQEPVAE